MTTPQLAPLRHLAFLHRLLCFVCLAVLSTAAALPGAETGKTPFDLPIDALEKSVKRFAAQSGLEVLIPSDALAEVRTRAVRGEMTSRQALDAMLAGTGLTVLQDPKTGALAVSRAADGNKAAQTAANDRPNDANGSTDSSSNSPSAPKKKAPKP